MPYLVETTPAPGEITSTGTEVRRYLVNAITSLVDGRHTRSKPGRT